MITQFFHKVRLTRKILYHAGRPRAVDFVQRIKPFLKKGEKILDVGSGSCHVCEMLHQLNYQVTPLDVVDVSLVEGVTPALYDGERMPFGDGEFDKSLILTVLHHIPDPEKVLIEVKRVSREMVIIEDIYSNRMQKYATFLLDSLIGFDFFGHPHTNKTDSQWRQLFQKLNLNLVEARYSRSRLGFVQVLYYLRS